MLPCCLMFKLNFLLELHKLCSLVILSDVKVINFLTCLLKLSLFLKLWFFMSLFIPLNLLILHLILILIFFSTRVLPFIASYLSSLIGVNVALPTITHFSCVSYLPCYLCDCNYSLCLSLPCPLLIPYLKFSIIHGSLLVIKNHSCLVFQC